MDLCQADGKQWQLIVVRELRKDAYYRFRVF